MAMIYGSTLPLDIMTLGWPIFISDPEGGRSSHVWCLRMFSYVSNVLNYPIITPWMSLCFPALEDYSLVQSCAVWNSFISLLLKPKFILLRNLINTRCSKLYFVYMLSQHLSYYILAIPTSDFPTRLWTYFCSLSSMGQLSLMAYAFTLVTSIFSGCEMTRFPNTLEYSLIKS